MCFSASASNRRPFSHSVCSNCSQTSTFMIAGLQCMTKAANAGRAFWTSAFLTGVAGHNDDVRTTMRTLKSMSLVWPASICQARRLADKGLRCCFQLQIAHLFQIWLAELFSTAAGRTGVRQRVTDRHACAHQYQEFRLACAAISASGVVLRYQQYFSGTIWRKLSIADMPTSQCLSTGASTSLCRLATPLWSPFRSASMDRAPVLAAACWALEQTASASASRRSCAVLASLPSPDVSPTVNLTLSHAMRGLPGSYVGIEVTTSLPTREGQMSSSGVLCCRCAVGRFD